MLRLTALMVALCACGVLGRMKLNENCGKTPIPPQETRTIYADEPDSRIVGGETVIPGSFPWQIELQRGTSFICGGVLVGNQHVITAAHCVSRRQPSEFRVRLGGFDRSANEAFRVNSDVSAISIHPDYNQNSPTVQGNDIAVLKLSSPVEFTDRIQPVCVAEDDDTVAVEPNTCYVTGWGRTGFLSPPANQLQQVRLPFVNQGTCRGTFGSLIDDTMVCAGQNDKSACSGDSGGPLVVLNEEEESFYLYGVVSWGRSTCSGAPGVFARVSYFTDFIEEAVDSL